MGQLPDFTNKRKYAARMVIIDSYRDYTGRHSIPQNRRYYTLCNIQGVEDPLTHEIVKSDYSEIEQMVSSGLIKFSQFVGIDKDEVKIAINRKLYPEATWICGDWSEVILKLSDANEFVPAVVYYDSTHTVSLERGLQTLADTMNACSMRQVLVAANVLLKVSQSNREFDENYLVENLDRKLYDDTKWECPDKLDNMIFEYKTNRVPMATHIYYRREL